MICTDQIMKQTTILWVLIVMLLIPVFSEARITRIVIDCARSQSPTLWKSAHVRGNVVRRRRPVREAAWHRLWRARSRDPRNAVITDLHLAPVNERGMVEYSTDIFILKPINLRAGKHRLLVDFNNRGQMRASRLNDAPMTNNPTTAEDAGTGFLMNLGYTIIGNGWDCGASGFEAMKITVPVATHDGATITGPSYEYIVFDNSTTVTSELAYAAATVDKSQAQLTVREHLDDTPKTVPASAWEYTSPDGTAIRLLPWRHRSNRATSTSSRTRRRTR